MSDWLYYFAMSLKDEILGDIVTYLIAWAIIIAVGYGQFFMPIACLKEKSDNSRRKEAFWWGIGISPFTMMVIAFFYYWGGPFLRNTGSAIVSYGLGLLLAAVACLAALPGVGCGNALKDAVSASAGRVRRWFVVLGFLAVFAAFGWGIQHFWGHLVWPMVLYVLVLLFGIYLGYQRSYPVPSIDPFE